MNGDGLEPRGSARWRGRRGRPHAIDQAVGGVDERPIQEPLFIRPFFERITGAESDHEVLAYRGVGC